MYYLFQTSNCVMLEFQKNTFSCSFLRVLYSLTIYLLERFLQIWSHLLKKSLMENSLLCVVLLNLRSVVSKQKIHNIKYSASQTSVQGVLVQ